MTLYWERENTPSEMQTALETLSARYPISCSDAEGMLVTFEKDTTQTGSEIRCGKKSVAIRYDTPGSAMRSVGSLLSDMVASGETYAEETPFKSFGIMLDCSRNAVMRPDHLKVWLERLALLGYNQVMLYTEDTYELPGEPYFGYQRGSYTASELQDIDDYASALNIEVVPCIQTLGHLAQILKHRAYNHVKDTNSVILAGEKQTYELIEKMISHWRSVCRTDRIHVGMDEAHDLGRGRYLDKHGYRNPFEIFNDHLTKVVEICQKYNFKPMLWSDMYFRLGNEKGHYYDPATKIPEYAVKKIPADADLVYWDYYHSDKEFYLDWIQRHRQMGKEPIMASGIHTWNKYWYDHSTTTAHAGACIEACKEADVAEIFFTQWGDNGAYCDHDSAFAGMAYCADKAYSNGEPSADILEKRFASVCGGSYKAHITASGIHDGPQNLKPNMWDDPIFDTAFRTWANDDINTKQTAVEHFRGLAENLEQCKNDRSTGDLLHAANTAHAFMKRYALSVQLLQAYRGQDEDALRSLKEEIPNVRKAVQDMAESFRAMWLRHNKPEGLERIQARLGMLDARYRELEDRLEELLAGQVQRIPELEYTCPPTFKE